MFDKVLLLVLVGVAQNVMADTYTWITPTNTAYYTMNTAARWVGGVAPDPAAGHSLDFSAEPMVNTSSGVLSGRGQSIEEVRLTYNNSNHAYDRIWGGYGRTLSIFFAGYNPSPTYSVNDPKDFEGLWWLSMPWTFTLNATAAHTPILRRVQVEGAPNFTVSTAGTTAVISNFFGRGTLCKSGEGTLNVVENEGPAQNVRVKKGTLNVAGAKSLSEGELAAVLATAAFHVDANRADSFTMEDGRIAQWHDVRGAGYPYGQLCTQNNKTSALPWRAEKALNELDMVDFGSYEDDMAVAGQTGNSAALAWSKDFGNGYKGPFVLEAFVVACFNDENGRKKGSYFSNLWDKPFRRNDGEVCDVGSKATSASNLQSNLNSRDGDFALTGVGARPADTIPDQSARIFSFRARENAYTRFSGFAVDYGGRVGGLKIGEAIYFTNFLTRVERRNVMRYLQKKWNLGWDGGEAEADVGTWLDETAATTFDVPAGGRVGIRELEWGTNTLEKTGAGELAVGSLYPQGKTGLELPVTISGGKLSYLGRLKVSANPQPAADAFRHYDADDAASIVAAEGNITEWKDQSGDDGKSATRLAASRTGNNTFGYPQYVTANGPNGHAYVDLGAAVLATSSPQTSGAFLFDTAQTNKDTRVLQEIFFAVRRKKSNFACWLLGSYLNSNVDFHPTAPELFRQPYANSALQGGEVTKNGRSIDPILNNNIEEWCVLRITPITPLHGALIGADRGGVGSSYLGGLELGEVIFYDRRLTRQEEIDTEAYLMKKWLGQEHPLAADERLKSLTYTATADATLDLKSDLTVGALNVEGASFTKTGPGALRAGELSGNATQLTVAEGTFALPDEAENIAFHFDALDETSFTTFVSGEEGNLRTNVVSWADVRQNGVAANAVYRDASITNPTLQQVEMRPGVWRPTVDFGDYADGWSNALKTAHQSTAGLCLNTRFTNIREAITVHADYPDVNPFLFADSQNVDYHRGNGTLIHNTYGLDGFRDPNAVILVNGEAKDRTYSPTKGVFNVISLAQATNTPAAAISQIALDRKGSSTITSSYRAGGMRCSEQIGFTRPLSNQQRDYWTRHLLYKWFGEGADPVITNSAYTALTLGPAATLTMPGNMLLEVASFTGGGKVVGRLALADPAALTVTLGSPLVVEGDFTVVGALALNIVLPTGTTAHDIAFGDYPLVTAATFDVDLAQCTFDSPLGGGKSVKLVQTDTSLALRVAPRGMVLSFR